LPTFIGKEYLDLKDAKKIDILILQYSQNILGNFKELPTFHAFVTDCVGWGDGGSHKQQILYTYI
jgi:hypothetical protein